ncbi:MAG: VCBS repeat-containing protein [Acidobacteriota bacterium]
MKTIPPALGILVMLLEGAPALRAEDALSLAGSGQQLNVLAGRGVAFADLNADGHLDAFVVNSTSPDGEGFRVYFGDGRGRFAESDQQLSSRAGFESRPAVGDFDGNGALDVVTGNTVWLNDGRGRLAEHADRIVSEVPADLTVVRAGDLNGDGRPDLVAVSDWRVLRIFLNDGQGRFRDTGQRHGGAGIVGSLALGDVDGNGTIDVVTGGWKLEDSSYCPSRVWLNDGHGRLHDSGRAFEEGGHHVHGIDLGDVNGDGRLDVVLAMTTPGHAAKVYLNEGGGVFRDSGRIIGHSWAHSVALGDLDGDGHPDLFLTCGEPATGTANEVWLNDGRGRCRDSGLRLGEAFSWDAALGDFNGDGRLDVFVANLRLVDGSKNPPVFGGKAAEVWVNTTTPGRPR